MMGRAFCPRVPVIFRTPIFGTLCSTEGILDRDLSTKAIGLGEPQWGWTALRLFHFPPFMASAICPAMRSAARLAGSIAT